MEIFLQLAYGWSEDDDPLRNRLLYGECTGAVVPAIRIGHCSPVFISSNVSNRGIRSITSFAAPFNPVPSV